jgi:predicted hotdog family 3-hydroxylacyl-ACP dehydratase
MPDFPPIVELLPHDGEMILLSEVIEYTEEVTVCRAVIRADGLFANADGSTGSWLGLELMAQCIAAHSGLVRRSEGQPPQIGFLISARRLHFASNRYHAGQQLRIRSEHVWGKSTGMVSLSCSIHDEKSDTLLAEAALNCFLPKNKAELEATLAASA